MKCRTISAFLGVSLFVSALAVSSPRALHGNTWHLIGGVLLGVSIALMTLGSPPHRNRRPR